MDDLIVVEFEDLQRVLPIWPESMTPRELQAKVARDNAFSQAIQGALANTPWCFRHRSMCKAENGWYMANLPHLAFEEGVVMCLTYKPLAIDPLYWDIVGLSVDIEESLPFRNQVHFTVQSPQYHAYLGESVSSVADLAKLTLNWTNEWFRSNKGMLDIDDMLARLGNLNQASAEESLLAICLSIQKGDLAAAADIARAGASKIETLENTAIAVAGEGAARRSIYDKVRLWLASEQRKRMRLAGSSTRT